MCGKKVPSNRQDAMIPECCGLPPWLRRLWKWSIGLMILGGVGLAGLAAEYGDLFHRGNGLVGCVTGLALGCFLTAGGLLSFYAFRVLRRPTLTRWRTRLDESAYFLYWAYAASLAGAAVICWYWRDSEEALSVIIAGPPRILGSALWHVAELPGLDEFSENILYSTLYYALLLSPILGLVRIRRLTLGYLAWGSFLILVHLIMVIQAFMLAQAGLTTYPVAPM